MTLVCLEIGRRRTFASALEWPGWSRCGRDELEALEALAARVDRYREVVDIAGLTHAEPTPDLVVVERLPGDMSTDFGAPGAIAEWERASLLSGEAQRLNALLQASWAVWEWVLEVVPVF